MKMGLFWGIAIVLIGLSIIINVVFKIDLPVFPLIIGIFFIFLGFRILLGAFGWHWHSYRDSRNVVLHEQAIVDVTGEKGEYNVVFGKAALDLTRLTLKEKVTRIEINSIFGAAEVTLSRELPVKIQADAAFGGVQLPDRSTGGFGTTYYQSPNFNENEKYLFIKASAVFGGLVIRAQ